MKRWLGLGLLFIVVLCASIAAHLPARVAVAQLPKLKGLQLEGVSGTIWQGKVQDVTWQSFNIGEVSWAFDASALIKMQALVDVRFGRQGELGLKGKTQIGYDAQGPLVQNLIASMPAEKITPWLELPVPIDALGQVELTLNQYRYDAPYCAEASGDLVWSGAQADSPFGGLDLDMVNAQLECQDNRITAKGSQRSAQVSAQFEASLDSRQQVVSSAWFKPEAEFPDNFRSQLKWLGQPDSQQRYSFDYSGRLPKF